MELEPDYKRFSCKCYPFPRINTDTFRKELQRLVKIVVLTLVQHSQYCTPVFIIYNKEGNARFVTGYRRLNQRLVRKFYPLPRIGKRMHHLEGFQYATALDINMGYYTVRIWPACQA